MKPQLVFLRDRPRGGHVYAINKLTSDARGAPCAGRTSRAIIENPAPAKPAFRFAMIEHHTRPRDSVNKLLHDPPRVSFSECFAATFQPPPPSAILAIFDMNYSVELFNCARGERKGAQGSVFNEEVQQVESFAKRSFETCPGVSMGTFRIVCKVDVRCVLFAAAFV